MRRREFISLLGGAALAWPRAAFAQAERVRRIGVLTPVGESDPEGHARIAAFRLGLREFGWTEGQNIRIDYRATAGDPERTKSSAAELVALKPDLIFAAPVSVVRPLLQVTKSVPIVFAQVPDPVALGLVQSLARPGGNLTGFALYEQSFGVKWVELLKQIAPSVVRVAVIGDPRTPSSAGYLAAIKSGGPSFGIEVASFPARNGAEIEHAFDAFAHKPNVGVIVTPSALAVGYRELFISLAAKHRLPAVYAYRYYPASGGLASYGVDNIDQYKRAASYVDRILRGEKPADLPIQFANKYELVINLKTAKTLGLDVPISLLARTDEVIE